VSGIAWQARPNTVVRSGYGRVYGQGWSGNTFGEVLAWTYPVQVSQNLNPRSQYFPSTYPDGITPVTLTNGPPATPLLTHTIERRFPLPNGIGVPTRPTSGAPAYAGRVEPGDPAGDQQKARLCRLRTSVATASTTCSTPQTSLILTRQPLQGLDRSILLRTPPTPTMNGSLTLTALLKTLGVPFGHPFGWTQSLRYNANKATSKYNALQVKLETTLQSWCPVS